MKQRQLLLLQADHVLPGKARDGFSIITLQTLAVQEDEVENEEKNDGLTPIPMEEVSEEPQIVQSPVPSEYPLASLSSDCLGKEFRLAILKTTQDFKVNKSNPYSWAWPGLVRLLANMEFRPKKSDILHESLDVWAAKNRDSLGAVRLVEIPQTPENGSDLADIQTIQATEAQERQAYTEVNRENCDIDRQYQDLKKQRKTAKAENELALARLQNVSDRKLELMGDLVRLKADEQRKKQGQE
ncbi:MAG: hypothetical protein LQ349_005653 [Xanthoria aureola]|nr:MAG: hypothetical protein LQ349_005653 [Xanthoria aureola]